MQAALAEALEGQDAVRRRGTGAVPATTAAGAANQAAIRKQQLQWHNRKEEQEEAERRRWARQEAEEEFRRRRFGDGDPLRDDRHQPTTLPSRGPPGWRLMAVGDEDLMPGVWGWDWSEMPLSEVLRSHNKPTDEIPTTLSPKTAWAIEN